MVIFRVLLVIGAVFEGIMAILRFANTEHALYYFDRQTPDFGDPSTLAHSVMLAGMSSTVDHAALCIALSYLAFRSFKAGH